VTFSVKCKIEIDRYALFGDRDFQIVGGNAQQVQRLIDDTHAGVGADIELHMPRGHGLDAR
jgi:hypothetical protein